MLALTLLFNQSIHAPFRDDCASNELNHEKQTGNGPSWRHIQGSKIAKGLQSVKYSLLQYPIFFEFFLKFPVSGIVPKNVKGGPFGIF